MPVAQGGGKEPYRLRRQAMRDKKKRRRLLEETERYLSELVAEVGEPCPEEVAEAQELARRLARRVQNGD